MFCIVIFVVLDIMKIKTNSYHLQRNIKTFSFFGLKLFSFTDGLVSKMGDHGGSKTTIIVNDDSF